MLVKRRNLVVTLLAVACCVLVIAAFLVFQQGNKDKPDALEEYREDVKQIAYLRKALAPGGPDDLRTFELFADDILKKWSDKKKELYAGLVLEICRPLSSGDFQDRSRTALARRYALSALGEPNQIALETELKLMGHAITNMGRLTPEAAEWVKIRTEDVEVRLHAWRRLLDAIDPNWDPNDLPFENIPPPSETGLPAGVAPEAIKDAKLRAEYEAAIQKNRQKAERHRKQSRARKWLRRFPKRAEEYMVNAYSTPPFNTDELKQLLERYGIDEQTRLRILDRVTQKVAAQTETGE